jgi:hypothetical protein
MVAFPAKPEQELIDRMYAAIKQKNEKPELYLGRLGSSFIGNDCVRAIWLSWRAYASSEFGGRMYRLFETGHLQEDRIVADLKSAGLTVFEKDAQGEQFQFIDETGHFISKVDGVAKDVPGSEKTPHILEVKTHNKNSFSAVAKHGVQKSKPLHYAQVQASMALSGMSRALYVALCKDDEQFYVERIKEDKPEQKMLTQRIISLVNATIKPAGISDDGEAFGCKFCDMKEVCVGRVAPVVTCRSCQFATAESKGRWLCNSTGEYLDFDAQRNACTEYEVL